MKELSLQVHLSDFIVCCNWSSAKDLISNHCDILRDDLTVETESVVLNIVFNLSMFMFFFIKFEHNDMFLLI